MKCKICRTRESDIELASALDAVERPVCFTCMENNAEPAEVVARLERERACSRWRPEIRNTITVFLAGQYLSLPAWQEAVALARQRAATKAAGPKSPSATQRRLDNLMARQRDTVEAMRAKQAQRPESRLSTIVSWFATIAAIAFIVADVAATLPALLG